MNVYILKNSYNFLQIMQEGEWIALAFQKN